MSLIVIIIPTYNERKNTGEMITALAKVIPQIKNHHVQVLYVDDSSPDGTAQIVKDALPKYSWLHLLGEGEKKGLGAAYARGMTYAMKEMKADYLMEFDADFQHPPDDIPRLVAEIDHGYDYILASRYIPGGSIPREWSFNRKFLSVVGNLVGRVGLLLPQIHDVTGGFKISKVKGFMNEFDFSTLYSKSFAYKVQLLFYMAHKGAKIKEVPIHFLPRTAGESKIFKNEMQETLRVIFLIQLHNPALIKFFKFGVVGGIGFIVNVVGARIFKNLLITPNSNVSLLNGLSNAMAAEISIISNFTWNNLWTFTADKITSINQLFTKFITFNLSSVITGILIPSFVIFLLTFFFGDHLFIYQIIAILVLTIPLNWFVYNKFIWKSKTQVIAEN